MIGEDGRLHTTFNQTVAATGRLSTTNPNLQSIPIRTELGREIRSAFVAEQGARLISADYSQIELRILAHVSGEPKLREAFERGEDIHTATAAEVLGVDPAKLTPGERSIAKMINFGIVYGISAFGLSENLEIPREQAQEYIDAYLARFPLVQDFIQRTIEQAERDGYATSLLGRRRPVPELRVRNRATRGFGERVAVNFVMQGSNADIIKVAMVAIEKRLREEGRSARLVLQVHDELLLEAPDAETSVGEGARARGDVLGVPARPAARGRRRRRRLLGRREELVDGARAKTAPGPPRPSLLDQGAVGLAAAHYGAERVAGRGTAVVRRRVLVDVDADRPGETTSIEVEGESTLGLTTGVVAAATPFGGVPGVLRSAIRRRQNGGTFSGKAAPVAVLVRRVVEDGVPGDEVEDPSIGEQERRAVPLDCDKRRRRTPSAAGLRRSRGRWDCNGRFRWWWNRPHRRRKHLPPGKASGPQATPPQMVDFIPSPSLSCRSARSP